MSFHVHRTDNGGVKVFFAGVEVVFVVRGQTDYGPEFDIIVRHEDGLNMPLTLTPAETRMFVSSIAEMFLISENLPNFCSVCGTKDCQEDHDFDCFG